jgi:hypothetical protein
LVVLEEEMPSAANLLRHEKQQLSVAFLWQTHIDADSTR